MFPFDDGCRKLLDISVTVRETLMNSTPQQCPPWTLCAWPPLLWHVGKQTPLHLKHLGTQIMNPGDALSRSMGQTLWAWHGDEGDVGLAWDWIQLTPGVVAMADPMAVVTNLRLLGDEGEVLTASESARHINYIVHGLPWQHEVQLALNGPAGAQAVVVGSVSPALPIATAGLHRPRTAH